MRMTDIKNKIHELIESAYKMGYEDGKNLEYDIGLNDAWGCARKIGKTNWITLEKMGFENKDKEKKSVMGCYYGIFCSRSNSQNQRV